MDKYILDGHEPVLVDDVLEWGQWFEGNFESRVVKQTDVGEVSVSTVFLGLDHAFGFFQVEHVPVLFETMVFGGVHDSYTERYATWTEAEEGHQRAVEMVKANA